MAIDGGGGGGGAGDGRRGGSGLGLWFVVAFIFVKKCLFNKKTIEAHAAPGGARHTQRGRPNARNGENVGFGARKLRRRP